MKKYISLCLVLLLGLTLTACGSSESTSEVDLNQEQPTAGEESYKENGANNANLSEENDHILVAYFSWSNNAILEDDVDAVTSPSVLSPGNVEELALWVQEETDGDLFSIQVTEPYSSDWDTCLERANSEKGEEARPELTNSVENFEDYDVIFLGYPNWWYGVPMALLSFLEEYDFTDKEVYLFCSHGTGGLAESVEIITETIPDAVISDNIFDCYEEDAPSSQEDIQNWVKELGY